MFVCKYITLDFEHRAKFPLFLVYAITNIVNSIFLLSTEDKEDIKFLGHSTESRSVLEALNKRKKSVFTLRKGTTENFMQAIEEVREGRMSFLAAGKQFGVSHMTLYRYYLSMGYPLVRKSHRTHQGSLQDVDFLSYVSVTHSAGLPKSQLDYQPRTDARHWVANNMRHSGDHSWN